MKNKVTAVILAAGEGRRMGKGKCKQLISIEGMTVLERSVLAFENSENIDGIVVVTRSEDLDSVRTRLFSFAKKLVSVVPGGATRFDSAVRGFSACSIDTEFVAFHDAARCLVTPDIIEKVLSAAKKHGAATAAVPIFNTVKRTDEEGNILSTVPRECLWAAQTPQIFRHGDYARAIAEIKDFSNVTDDNMLMEKIGVPVKCVDCGNENVKITTPSDLDFARYIISVREKESSYV